eukprot:2489006-Prymnesium_polylepis.2
MRASDITHTHTERCCRPLVSPSKLHCPTVSSDGLTTLQHMVTSFWRTVHVPSCAHPAPLPPPTGRAQSAPK